MKKELSFGICLMLSICLSFAQTIEEISFRGQYSDVVAVDLNNDGHLDVVAYGADVNALGKNNIVYMNDGSGNLTELSFTEEKPNLLTGESRACMHFDDFNGDSILDVILGGRTTMGVFQGKGDGTFTSVDFDLPSLYIACAWADFDNNGLLDYVAIGEDRQGEGGIYYNNGDGTYTLDTVPFADNDFWEAELALADYNSDGNVDFFVNAWEDLNEWRFSRMFYNDGYDIYVTNPGISYQKANGTANWADVDGNGTLDLLFGGDGGTSSEETSDAMMRIFTNSDGVLTEKQVIEGYRPLNTGGSSAFADWDNDGDYDAIMTGWSDLYSNQLTHIYYNDGAGNFTLSGVSIYGVSDGGATPMDVNEDGKIDLICHGYCGDAGGWYSFICYNTTAETSNTRPSAPTNIYASKNEDGGVVLSWDQGSDEETEAASLSYEIFLKKADSETYLIAPASFVGGDNDGKRKVVRLGNAYLNTTWTFNDLDGSYEWGVQAIDAAYEGSTFTTGTFNTADLTAIETNKSSDIEVFPNPASGTINIIGVENGSAVLYSIDGTCSKTIQNINGSINVSDLNNGIYILKINDSYFKKVIVNN